MAIPYDLKKPEEVKEYLKNLHIEYKFGCYSEKNAEVCHLLGDFAEAVDTDYKTAADLYKSTCDNYNYGRSCAKYGDFRAAGRGCDQDTVEAFKYMRKGCENGSDRGCLHAGALATSLKDVGETDKAKQVDLGVTFLKKACHEYNVEKACFLLSGLYLGGLPDYVDKNYTEAYKLSLKCCEIGNPYACANLSQMHQRGEGVEKNPGLAATFKKRAEELYRELKGGQKQIKFHQGI